MKSIEITDTDYTVAISYNHYRKYHIPTQRIWDCEFEAGFNDNEKLQLINVWNGQGFGVWQYYTII